MTKEEAIEKLEHVQRVESVDLISRQDAIDALAKFVPYAIDDMSTESYTNGLTDAYNLICQLPSAEITGAMDEAIQEYIKDGYMQPIGEDLISRQAAIDAVNKNRDSVFHDSVHYEDAVYDISNLPSAETPTVSEKHQLSEETPTNTPTDLISRKDAVEAFADMREGYPVVHGDMLSDAEVVAILHDLPLVRSELIRCKDCKYYKAKQGGLPWNHCRRYCNRSVTLATNPDDFCSYGERMVKYE